MNEKQPSSDRRSFARGVLTVAGAGAIASCAGDSGSTEDEGSSGPEESDTDPAGNGSNTGDSEPGEDNSRLYGQRWMAETAFSVMKLRFSPAVHPRAWYRDFRELMLTTEVYNLEQALKQ